MSTYHPTRPLAQVQQHYREGSQGLTTWLEEARVEQVEKDRWRVKLADKDQGIAAGQSTVFYREDICLGSGVIE